MNVRSINNFTQVNAADMGVIFANNAILGSLSIVGQLCDKYITSTTDQHPHNIVVSEETRHTNTEFRCEKLISRYLQFVRRKRDVPKDP